MFIKPHPDHIDLLCTESCDPEGVTALFAYLPAHARSHMLDGEATQQPYDQVRATIEQYHNECSQKVAETAAGDHILYTNPEGTKFYMQLFAMCEIGAPMPILWHS